MSNPLWRRKLRELVGAELAKFIPRWIDIKPTDIPQDFLIELEFFNWWLEVKDYAAKGEYHPSISNQPKSGVLGKDGVYASVDLTGTGLPRKFERFYLKGKGLSFPEVNRQVQWPVTLFWPWFAVTLGDNEVTITESQNPQLPLNSPRNRWGTQTYNPGERLCEIINQDPQKFIDSLNFRWGHYQIYLKLASTERKFLAAIQGTYSYYPNSHWWQGHTSHQWEPERYLPGINPKHCGRHLGKLECLELITVHRRDNNTITHFDWKLDKTGALIHICQQLCK